MSFGSHKWVFGTRFGGVKKSRMTNASFCASSSVCLVAFVSGGLNETYLGSLFLAGSLGTMLRHTHIRLRGVSLPWRNQSPNLVRPFYVLRIGEPKKGGTP